MRLGLRGALLRRVDLVLRLVDGLRELLVRLGRFVPGASYSSSTAADVSSVYSSSTVPGSYPSRSSVCSNCSTSGPLDPGESVRYIGSTPASPITGRPVISSSALPSVIVDPTAGTFPVTTAGVVSPLVSTRMFTAPSNEASPRPTTLLDSAFFSTGTVIWDAFGAAVFAAASSGELIRLPAATPDSERDRGYRGHPDQHPAAGLGRSGHRFAVSSRYASSSALCWSTNSFSAAYCTFLYASSYTLALHFWSATARSISDLRSSASFAASTLSNDGGPVIVLDGPPFAGGLFPVSVVELLAGSAHAGRRPS